MSAVLLRERNRCRMSCLYTFSLLNVGRNELFSHITGLIFQEKSKVRLWVLRLIDRINAHRCGSAISTVFTTICQLLPNVWLYRSRCDAYELEFSPRPPYMHCCDDHTPDKYREMSAARPISCHFLCQGKDSVALPVRWVKNLQQTAAQL